MMTEGITNEGDTDIPCFIDWQNKEDAGWNEYRACLDADAVACTALDGGRHELEEQFELPAGALPVLS